MHHNTTDSGLGIFENMQDFANVTPPIRKIINSKLKTACDCA